MAKRSVIFDSNFCSQIEEHPYYIVFNGTDTLNSYQYLLNSETLYGIGDEPPCPLSRTIRITINDDRLLNSCNSVM